MTSSVALSGVIRTSQFASDWRESLNVLRLALMPAFSDDEPNNELGVEPPPRVRLRLEVCGLTVGEWYVAPAEIELPVHLEDLGPATEDALTRWRKVLQKTSPTDFLTSVLGEIQDRSGRIQLPAFEQLTLAADAFTNAAGSLEESLVGNDGLVTRFLTDVQRAAEEKGAPVKPEDLRALRQAPHLFMQLLSSGASRSLGLAQRVFDSVTEDRADRLRRLLPYGRLPRRICRQIGAHIQNSGADVSALWIEFEQPAGYLPILPWERLLQSATSLPILRLPYHHHEPNSSNRCENILLFYASPSWNSVPSPRAVVDMIEAFGNALPRKKACCVHLFADARHRSELQTVLADRALPIRVRLVDYPEANSRPSSEHDDDHWSAWFRASLPDIAVDVIHGLAPAEFVEGQPAIMIPSSPWNQDSGLASAPRPITCPLLVRLANTFGAHTSVLTAFGNEESRAAWRLLADDFAQSRPGTLAYHDFQSDALGLHGQRFAGISAFYASVARPPFDVSHPSLSVHCHPAQLAPRTIAPSDRPDLPAWLAITQRSVENLAATVSSGSTPADQAMRAGASAARRLVDELARQALEASLEIDPEQKLRAYLDPPIERTNAVNRKATQ